jgi:hypothetical protein
MRRLASAEEGVMPQLTPVEATSRLTLGWQVTQTRDPRYWLASSARAGEQKQEDLVQVPAQTLGTHAAIIAQSGSGKSFFLGRLVEEIAIATRARCLILDSNADFRRIAEVYDAALWRDASYDTRKRRGSLPHERSRNEFWSPWSQLNFKIRTASPPFTDPYEPITLWWPDLSPDFLAEDVEPMLRSDFYHCHSFVRAIADLVERKRERSGGLNSRTSSDNIDVIDMAEKLLPEGRKLAGDFVHRLKTEFDVGRLQESETARYIQLGYPKGPALDSLVKNRVERVIKRAAAGPAYVSEVVERFYFGKAREYQAAGILSRVPRREQQPNRRARVEVVDLPSIQDKRIRLLAVSAAVAVEWQYARQQWSRAIRLAPEQDRRVPTFIVIDEAHNLIPAEPQGKAEQALREQFRTIVAEGRKYGLFLILASQRPDKLDPLVLSECENKAVMRLSSGSVLGITQKLLGLDSVPPRLLEKCLEFEIGRALLVGPWCPDGPTLLYSAARRTIEGGRNLREDHWAVPSRKPELLLTPARARALRPKLGRRRRMRKARIAARRSPNKE